MARLRNRLLYGADWTDGEKLRWHRDKRFTFQGLKNIAEDSGCIVDDPFEWKLALWPSPRDADITVELLEQWREELIEAGYLVPYTVDGKRYLFIVELPKRERPRNPQAPDLPLPPWVTYTTRGEGRGKRIEYHFADYRDTVQPASGDRSTTVQSSSGDRSTSPTQHTTTQHTTTQRSTTQLTTPPDRENTSAGRPTDGRRTSAADELFERFWSVYPKRVEKAKARRAWTARLRQGRSPEDIVRAAELYAQQCESEGTPQRFIKHPATFIGSNEPYLDYLSGSAGAPDPHDLSPDQIAALCDGDALADLCTSTHGDVIDGEADELDTAHTHEGSTT